MYGGLRLGESCAITRLDVNGDRLRVDKQVQALRETGKPTIVHITQVKTHEDDIVIPLWLAERLRDITTTAKPDGVRESLRRAGNRVGISLNPHQLRHWYATTALERGVPMLVVSQQLRHSDIATTLRVYAQHDATGHVHKAFG
jgi:integrase